VMAGVNSTANAYGTGAIDGADQGVPVDSKHIVHISLTEGMDHAWPFGISVLEPIFKVFKQKELLEDSIIIDPKKQTNRDHVFFGATVDLLNILDDIEIKIQIVGQSEIDTSKGKISWQSPLSKAILGKSIGDIVKIDTPSGFSDYEILDIKYE
ncbi:MAG: portal protein, partial [Burkholderiaceae bacterium]